MESARASKDLVGAVARIRDHVLRSQKGKYLPQLVQPSLESSWNITNEEGHRRKEALALFQKLQSFQMVKPALYTQFLKALYPTRNNLARFGSSQSVTSPINHNMLFSYYAELPRPGVGHLNYNDFETFMHHAFSRRDFVRPNALSSTSALLYSDEQVVKAYVEAHNTRQAQLSELWSAVNDMQLAEIPISAHEQRSLIFKTFYRDRPDIMSLVKAATARLPKERMQHWKAALEKTSKPAFDWETYVEMRERAGDESADSLNVLLFTALRHDNHRAVADIESRLKNPNRSTFKILLENLSYKGNEAHFVKHLVGLQERPHLLDISLLNVLVGSLAHLGHVQLAQELVQPFCGQDQLQLAEKDQFLKLLTSFDKERYKAHLTSFDELSNKPLMKLHPTEETFLPLVKHYCTSRAPFEKVVEVLFNLEHVWGLPLSSRVFKNIYSGFSGGQWSLSDLQFVTGKLIDVSDRYSGNNAWVRNNLEKNSLPASVATLLLEVVGSLAGESFSTENGLFTKLSDRLMAQVFAAYELVSQRARASTVANIKKRYLLELEQTRARHGKQLRKESLVALELYEREEVVHLKKCTLLELLDAAD